MQKEINIDFSSSDMDLYIINDQIRERYRDISEGNYNHKKHFFNMLHYLKLIKEYIIIKKYKKKTLYNEKLLNNLEKTLLDKGFYPNENRIYLYHYF